MGESVAVLFSGGLDSLAGLQYARTRMPDADITALYVDFGHRYARQEIQAVTGICATLGEHCVIRNFPAGDMEADDAHIPLRNLYLLQLASYYGDTIIFGMLLGENSPDNNPAFVRRMTRLLNSQYRGGVYRENSRKIEILTPFKNMSKSETVHWYLRHGGTAGLVRRTIGCYAPESHCGRCMPCFNRWVALTNNGVEEEYPKGHPMFWAVPRLLVRRKGTLRFSPGTLLQIYHRRGFLKDAYRALRTVDPHPLKLYLRLHKQALEA